MAPEENAGTELLLQSFKRRFLAARTLRSFPWQSLEAKLSHSSDSELLRDILQKHEAVHTETLDELYEELAETLMAEESTQGHRSYLLASGGSVILSESTAIISHGTTGLVTWDAALYLAEWAIENPAAFTHRRAVLPRSHRVAGRGPAEAGCLPGVQAGSCGLSGLHCPQPRDGPAVYHGARSSAIASVSVFYVWPKAILLLPVWPREAKRLDTPHIHGQAGPGSDGKQKLIMTRNCFPMESTWRWQC
ncbi:putative protein FAM86C2P isoform X2 [Pongo pygmaeus]|uniref:putative protein FAM86C2P isoform X2 n=1 Tax=Pongo pygmaeus TaxID=9600 RepID=UPI00300D7152